LALIETMTFYELTTFEKFIRTFFRRREVRMNAREGTTKQQLLWQNKQHTSNNMEVIMHITLYFGNVTNCRRGEY